MAGATFTVYGTTGAATFTLDQGPHQVLTAAAQQLRAGRLQLVVACGPRTAEQLVAELRHLAQLLEADAIEGPQPIVVRANERPVRDRTHRRGRRVVNPGMQS